MQQIPFNIPTTDGPRSLLIYMEQIFYYLGQNWVIFREGRRYNISHFETGINFGYVTTPTHKAIFSMFQKRIPGKAQRNTPDRDAEMLNIISIAVNKEYFFSLSEKNTAPANIPPLTECRTDVFKIACAKEYKERREADKEQRAALAQQERAARLSDPDKIPAAAKKWADELINLPSDPAEYYTDDYILQMYGDICYECREARNEDVKRILLECEYLPEITAAHLAPVIAQMVNDGTIEPEISMEYLYWRANRELSRVDIGECCEEIDFHGIEIPDYIKRRKYGLLQVARYLCEKYNDWSHLEPADYIQAIDGKSGLGFYYVPSSNPAALLPPLDTCMQSLRIENFFARSGHRIYFVFPLKNGLFISDTGEMQNGQNLEFTPIPRPWTAYQRTKYFAILQMFCKNALLAFDEDPTAHAPEYSALSAAMKENLYFEDKQRPHIKSFISKF